MDDQTTHLSYRVWLDIEAYDHDREEYYDMDAPGSALTSFERYQDAYDYAGRVTDLAQQLNLE